MERLLDLLRFEGRRSRLGYWRANLKISALSAVVIIIGYATMTKIRWLGVVLLTPMLPLFLAQAAIIVQRLHDRNRPGLLAIPLVLAIIISGLVSNATVQLVAALLALVAGWWAAIEISFLRGTRGDNRFGPDPSGGPDGYRRAAVAPLAAPDASEASA